jgi:HEAT repeat protein
LLLLLLATVAGCSGSESSRLTSPLAANQSSGRSNSPGRQAQPDANEVSGLKRRLQDSDEAERGRAKRDLSSLAQKSVELRGQVIRELIELMETSDDRRRLSSPAHNDAWTFAAELLGQLKATEALDVLIDCIHCDDGHAGLSFDRYPALKAVTAIGSEAIPNLTLALSHDRPEVIKYAALALGEIGGAEAKQALGNALSQEQDKDVLTCIKIALRQH